MSHVTITRGVVSIFQVVRMKNFRQIEPRKTVELMMKVLINNCKILTSGESYSDILDLLSANLAHINSKQSVIFLWALVI